MSPRICASILSADFTCLGQEVRRVEEAGADGLHIDVMDGHFVPNLSIGPPVIKALRAVTNLPFDVHLMLDNAASSVAQYVDAGANTLFVHAEACTHLHKTLTHIRSLGARPGVSLNPATPLGVLTYVLHLVEAVLVMTVNPGFSGQAFLPEMQRKIADLAALKAAGEHKFLIEVDGGINVDTVGQVVRCGAQCIVAGQAVFGAADYSQAIGQLRAQAQKSSPTLRQHPPI